MPLSHKINCNVLHIMRKINDMSDANGSLLTQRKEINRKQSGYSLSNMAGSIIAPGQGKEILGREDII